MKQEQIKNGFTTAFLDSKYPSNIDYKPQFLYNDNKQGIKVLSTIKNELNKCDEFIFSVAFITMTGITPLLGLLEELRDRGVKGKILTTNYLNFTEPKALKKLNEFPNIEVRMYNGDHTGFHTKGYIFRKDDVYKLIVGSSNMTGAALTKNKEWNSVLVSTTRGEYAISLLGEFGSLWEADKTKAFDEFINEYERHYEENRLNREHVEKENNGECCKLAPNKMQECFINNLNRLVKEDENRALLLSATGTGKTYAAAFAVEDMKPKRILFVVHREDIARKAMKSFKNVITGNKTWGLISGTEKGYEAEYIFSTMNMMSKSEVYEKYEKTDFDVIIIDEAHRAGAESYQRIINYFQPKMLLGMTATPERTDGFDIFKLFGNNIAYEIRLQQAMEEEMLTPFHYFGITDLKTGEIQGEVSVDFNNFNYLTSQERIEYIIEKINYYSYSGPRVKGLIFCSRKEEANRLSEEFNHKGFRTSVLSGDHNQETRERTIERLVGDDGDDALDYIFTVDIFNEGIDIPEINQVVMLRPTESPVVFVQQLGRGLRKDPSKEYVVVLDFIGNYSNNFMIPIALSGDRSYNKDNIRRYVMEGERILPGCSTIHFDKISKQRIFSAIDDANFTDIRLLKESYANLKNKLGRIPSLQDFEVYGSIDVIRIFDNNTLGSYYKFLLKYEKDYTVRLSVEEEKVIEFISKKLANGKRPHELLFIRKMLEYQTNLLRVFSKTMEDERNTYISEQTINNVVNVMTNEFPTGGSKKTYSSCVLIEEDGNKDYVVKSEFSKMLANKEFKDILVELLEFGIERNKRDYSKRYLDSEFQLYQKYAYEDVCRLLDWNNNEVPLNIGGYKYDKLTNTFPVFINYHKADDISDTTKYGDHFVSANHLVAISKQGRTVESEDVKKFLNAKKRGIKVDLFIRKNKDDKGSKEFYYLGRMSATGCAKEFIMENTNKTAVEIEWVLDTPVRQDIFDYITSN